MVTANRPTLASRAVLCYNRQTYDNKELVVIDDGETDLSPVLADVPSGELAYIRLEPNPDNVLGMLRNISLEQASGTFVTQWDDDDWYHPDRIRTQVAPLVDGNDACCLGATLMHVDNEEYFLHPYAGHLPDGVPGTIMHRNDNKIRYPEVRRAEDTTYLDEWRERRYVKLPPEQMHLFIRCYHGENTWELDHFLRRMRNTASDLFSYGWRSLVGSDVFSHPRFQLSDESKEAFEMYLEDSYATGIFSRD